MQAHGCSEPHRARLCFSLVQPAPHICGWTNILRLFTRAEVLDYLPDQNYLWSTLTENEQRVINQVQAASQTDRPSTSADAVLRGFAYNLRLQFFIELALRARHQDAVTLRSLRACFGPSVADTGSAASQSEIVAQATCYHQWSDVLQFADDASDFRPLTFLSNGSFTGPGDGCSSIVDGILTNSVATVALIQSEVLPYLRVQHRPARASFNWKVI